MAIDGAEGRTLDARRGRGDVGEGARVTLGVRPEHLNVAEDGLRAAVEMAEDLGGVSYLHVRLADGHNLVVERRGTRENLEGTTIGLGADPGQVLVFGDDGRRLR